MAGRSKKKEIREEFHRELHNHIRMLKREFEKVETIVTHTSGVETDNEEIMALKSLRDAKIRLLRIRFRHEADLIIEEFKNGVEEVLDRDGLANSDLVNADRSGSNGNGKHDGRAETKGEEVAEREKIVSKKTDDKKPATRRAPRQRAGKRARKYVDADKYPDNEVGQAANDEHSKGLLRRIESVPKNLSASARTEDESDEEGNKKSQKRPLGKIRLKLGPDHSRHLAVQKVRANEDRLRESTAPEKHRNEASSSGVAMESSKQEKGNEDQENVQKTVRRSRRERKQTPKAKETKRVACTRAPRR